MLEHVGETEVAVDVTLINDCEELKWGIEQSVLDFASIQAKENIPLRGAPNSNQLQKNGIMFSWLSDTLLTSSDLVITKENKIN